MHCSTLNKRTLRSGLSVSSSPIRKMPPPDPKKSPTRNPREVLTCNVQDLWGLLTSLHTTVMKQGEELKLLALKNQELEHVVKAQEVQIKQLNDNFDNQQTKVHDTLTAHSEKVTLLCEQVQNSPMYVHENNAMSWANVVKSENENVLNAPVVAMRNAEMNAHEVQEMQEREKRSMNIVVRGLPEPDTESALSLNIAVTDLLTEKMGMQDLTIFGAHRVGKKNANANRAIVCTMLDARKRTLILENARFYLKDSTFYISEDRTPAQQEKRRQAYEERIKKKTSPKDPPEAPPTEA